MERLAAVDVEHGDVGIDRDRQVPRRERLLGSAERHESVPAPVVRGGPPGIDRESAVERLQGLGGAA